MRNVCKTVCLREPGNTADRNQVDTITDNFVANNSYNMKNVFAETAVYCMGN